MWSPCIPVDTCTQCAADCVSGTSPHLRTPGIATAALCACKDQEQIAARHRSIERNSSQIALGHVYTCRECTETTLTPALTCAVSAVEGVEDGGGVTEQEPVESSPVEPTAQVRPCGRGQKRGDVPRAVAPFTCPSCPRTEQKKGSKAKKKSIFSFPGKRSTGDALLLAGALRQRDFGASSRGRTASTRRR